MTDITYFKNIDWDGSPIDIRPIIVSLSLLLNNIALDFGSSITAGRPP
jgi:hypothetical protein